MLGRLYIAHYKFMTYFTKLFPKNTNLNNQSNAIAPMIAIWLIFNEGTVQQKSESPLYMLLYGGIGMSLGMWLFGKRVNQTIGKSLTKIVPMT
jgi:solute carrier family 20 (sodium-dependent phosphate transporter)